jgi:hypothetical protein
VNGAGMVAHMVTDQVVAAAESPAATGERGGA